MYGYIRVDKETIGCEASKNYYAHFCGLCVASGKNHGQLSRLLVTYDTAFLDIFMRAMVGENTQICEKKCVASKGKPRRIAAPSPLTKLILEVSIVLAYLKIVDDIVDGGGLKRRLMRVGIRRSYNKAKKTHGAIEGHLRGLYEGLRASERAGGLNLERISDYFGQMLSAAAAYILTTQKIKKFSDEQGQTVKELFYVLGKFIYILDAVDDRKSDMIKGCYNPLTDTQSLSDAKFLIGCLAAKTADCYEKLELDCHKSMLDNIIYTGLIKRASKILKGEDIND